MRCLALTAAALLGLAGCSETLESPDSLARFRIVNIRTEPPALIAPGTVTASIRVADPEFRSAEFTWYLALAFRPDRLIGLAERDWAGSDAPGIDDGFVALGTGPTVTLPVPPLPLGELPEDILFDTVPLPLAVSIRIDGREYKAIKQVRLVIPELVERGLARTLGRAPTTAETAEALRVRLNRNPEVKGWRYARVPDRGEYDLDAIIDLKVRRGLRSEALAAPALPVGARQGLRFEPIIVDPDVRPDDQLGQPGFNYLSADLLRTAGESYPLTLTAYDWVPLRLVQKNLFDPPDIIRDVVPDLQTVRWVLNDRQGGTAHQAIEIDLGGPPPEAMRGPAGALLIREATRMLWLAAADPALIAAAEAATGPQVVVARLWYDPRPPLGVTGSVETLAPLAVTPTTAVLDGFDADPALRARLRAVPVTLEAEIRRVWRP